MAKAKGFAGMSYKKIMKQQAKQMMKQPVYCRYCGLDVKHPSRNQPEIEWNQNLAWEEQNHAHVKCHQQHIAKERGMM